MPVDDAPIREFPDRGTIWLLESPANLRDLIAMVAQDIADGLDFDRAERINRSFVPDDLRKTEADLLFRVPFRSGPSEVWVHVLVEHQSKPDRFMGLRVLTYMVQIWEMERRRWDDESRPASARRLSPVVPIVFYTGRRRWAKVPSVSSVVASPAELCRFIPVFETLFLSLEGLTNDDLPASALGAVLRVVQASDRSVDELERVLADAVRVLDALPSDARAEWMRAIHYLVLLIRHTREPAERALLYDVVSSATSAARREELAIMKMTDAQALIAQGRRQGRQEGRREGREEAFAALLVTMIERRFGPLSDQQRAAVARLSDDRAVEIGLSLLEARSLEELGL